MRAVRQIDIFFSLLRFISLQELWETKGGNKRVRGDNTTADERVDMSVALKEQFWPFGGIRRLCFLVKG